MCLENAGDCEEALRAMYLYIDRELPHENSHQVKDHLDDCFPCLQKFEFEAELKQIISSRCKDDVPDHLYERVRMSLLLEIEKAANAKEQVEELDAEGGIPGS